MDKARNTDRWSWLPAHMPGVAKLLAEKKRLLGEAHVRHCWDMGVNKAQPGWFFAREGPLAVGTIWPEMADVAGWQVTLTQAIVILKEPEARSGT